MRVFDMLCLIQRSHAFQPNFHQIKQKRHCCLPALFSEACFIFLNENTSYLYEIQPAWKCVHRITMANCWLLNFTQTQTENRYQQFNRFKTEINYWLSLAQSTLTFYLIIIFRIIMHLRASTIFMSDFLRYRLMIIKPLSHKARHVHF